MLMSIGNAYLPGNIREQLKVGGGNGVKCFVLIGIIINDPSILQLYNRWSFRETGGKRRGNILIRTEWIITESNFQIPVRTGVILQHKHVIFRGTLDDHRIDYAKTWIEKECSFCKCFKILR